MGDRIAIMRAGRLVQYDTPAVVLARPADAFVEEFVGPDRALKRLSLLTVDGLLTPASASPSALTLPSGTNLRDALSQMMSAGVTQAGVVGEAGRILGSVSRDAILGS